MADTAAIGLKDIVVANTTICFIDGDKGILNYRGVSTNDLAERSTYEETAFLILNGFLPTQKDLDHFSKQLASERPIPEQLIDQLKTFRFDNTPLMANLRSAVSLLSMYDADSEKIDEASDWKRAMRLTACTATIVAALERIRQGKAVLEPRTDLSHAGNFLYMLTGQKPDETCVKALDVSLILQAEHDLNASTFAGRVTASTLSDMYSAATSAVGALKGPLHGGANLAVIRVLEKIGSPDQVVPFVKKAIANKDKLMGFGHRVYRVLDPRAVHMKRMSKALSEKIGPNKWYEMSVLLEETVKKEKPGLNANLDFYAASVYRYLGFSNELFPMIFAMGRMIGWTTHFVEQYRDNNLIRPLTHYVGPVDVQYTPIAQRSGKPGASL